MLLLEIVWCIVRGYVIGSPFLFGIVGNCRIVQQQLETRVHGLIIQQDNKTADIAELVDTTKFLDQQKNLIGNPTNNYLRKTEDPASSQTQPWTRRYT